MKHELAPAAPSTQAPLTPPPGPRSRRSARQTLLALAISAGLALTPELVRTVVEGRPPALVARLWPPPGLRARSAGPAPTQPRAALPEAAAAEQPWADVEVRASGIRCAGCAARVRRAVLDALPAGAECRVEFESGRIAASGRGVTAAAVAAAVEGLGYAVRAAAPPAHAAPEAPAAAAGEL